MNYLGKEKSTDLYLQSHIHLNNQPVKGVVCWWRVPPEWTNTTTVRKSAHQSKRTTPKRKQGFAQLSTTLSLYSMCAINVQGSGIYR